MQVNERFQPTIVAFCCNWCSYAWVETIEDEELYRQLRTLSAADLELITLIAMEGYRQSEVARMWGCSQVAVHKRMKKIKKILRSG